MADEPNPVPKVFQCIVYLKTGATVTTETEDPDALIASLRGFLDAFYSRGLFSKRMSTVVLNGTPTVVIPLEHINFISVLAKGT